VRFRLLYAKGVSGRLAFLALIVTATMSTQAGAQVSAAQVLARVSSTYRGLRTYRLDAIERLSEFSPRLGRLSLGQANSSVAADLGGKARVYREDDRGALLIVSNGDITWTYDSALQKYTREMAAPDLESEAAESDFADGELHLVGPPLDTIRLGRPGRHLGINTYRSSADLLSHIHERLIGRYTNLDHYDPDARLLRRERIKVGDEKAECYIISLDGGHHKLWVDEQRFLVLRHQERIQFANAPKSVITLEVDLSGYRIGAPLDPTLFEFTPPSGAALVSQLGLQGVRANLTGNGAPNFELLNLNGQSVRLGDYLGQVILLDFWATWCGPCRVEQPIIAKLYQDYKEKGLAVFGVNAEAPAIVEKYLKKQGLDFPVLTDAEKTVRTLYGCQAIPMLVVINRQGVVTKENVGEMSEDELLTVLRTAGLNQD